jgi:exonuclease III
MSKHRTGKRVSEANKHKKQSGVTILISNKIDFQPKLIKKDGEGHVVLIKERVHHVDITILNIYAPNARGPIHKRNITKA